MARKRMIDPSIWQSEDFSELSNLAKLVFIALFSLADDDGRGRANPVYLRNTIFPYNEDLRSTDIEKALSEISLNMSVIFYSCDGSKYYALTNWDKWQKIDKPTPSKIPEYKENMKIETFADDSTRTSRKVGEGSRLIEKNKNKKRIKKEEKKKEFIAPSLDEIKKYVSDKKLNVDAEKFYSYFTEGNWIDSKGNKVKNWKQKLLTWNGFSENKSSVKNDKPKNALQTNDSQYDDLSRFYTNFTS